MIPRDIWGKRYFILQSDPLNISSQPEVGLHKAAGVFRALRRRFSYITDCPRSLKQDMKQTLSCHTELLFVALQFSGHFLQRLIPVSMRSFSSRSQNVFKGKNKHFCNKGSEILN